MFELKFDPKQFEQNKNKINLKNKADLGMFVCCFDYGTSFGSDAADIEYHLKVCSEEFPDAYYFNASINQYLLFMYLWFLDSNSMESPDIVFAQAIEDDIGFRFIVKNV